MRRPAPRTTSATHSGKFSIRATLISTSSHTDFTRSQKFAKLEKNATDQYGDFDAAANAAPAPAKKTTKRKSAKKAAEDKEDGEDESAAPKTKTAKTTKKSASAPLFSAAIATTNVALQ